MKTIFKVLTAIVALGVVILVGLHLFLQYGLTRTMREVVLPRVEEETGIVADVGGLSVNAVAGVLHIKDVEVRNPEGFLLEKLASIDRIGVEVDVLSLLKGKPIHIRNVEMENARLNIVRNRDGEINLIKLQERFPQAEAPSEKQPEPGDESTVPDRLPEPARPPVESRPIAELLIEALQCNARVRYLDLSLHQLDFSLDLAITGSSLSTLQGTGTPWGDISVIGALGSGRTSFVTDLQIKLAPVTDPKAPSFDLSGSVLEIDPRIMEKIYDKAGIRSAPFGIDPSFHCRSGNFEDSTVALNIPDIRFEDKLAKRLGGVGSIGSLRFSVPVEGTLHQPSVDVLAALRGAVGGNVPSMFNSIIKGVAGKEAGLPEAPETLGEAAVEVLGEKVEEIGGSETVKKVLKELADGQPSDTNAPPPAATDVLVDILGEQVDEIGEDEELKKGLKDLGKFLFGK
jgi:hypothetical protein